MDGIPEDFCFDELPDGTLEHFEPVLDAGAWQRMPALARPPASRPSSAGPRASRRTCATTSARRRGSTAATSPPGSTPSACSRPAASGGCWPNAFKTGTGRCSTCGTWTSAAITALPDQPASYLRERVSETLGLLYDDPLALSPVRHRAGCAPLAASRSFAWPLVPATARSLRLGAAQLVRGGPEHGTPLRVQLRAAELVRTPRRKSTARCGSSVGLFDLTSFAKFRLQGVDAVQCSQHCLRQRCGRADPGRIVYTQWLNDAGRHRSRPHRDPARRRLTT